MAGRSSSSRDAARKLTAYHGLGVQSFDVTVVPWPSVLMGNIWVSRIFVVLALGGSSGVQNTCGRKTKI